MKRIAGWIVMGVMGVGVLSGCGAPTSGCEPCTGGVCPVDPELMALEEVETPEYRSDLSALAGPAGNRNEVRLDAATSVSRARPFAVRTLSDNEIQEDRRFAAEIDPDILDF